MSAAVPPEVPIAWPTVDSNVQQPRWAPVEELLLRRVLDGLRAL